MDPSILFGRHKWPALRWCDERRAVAVVRAKSPLGDVIEEGKQLTEVKSENSINRLTAKANPRPMERVVPGVTFDCEFLFRIIDLGDGGKEDTELFNDVVLLGLALLEQDAIGGCGSRGCGRISLDLKLNGEPLQLPSLAGTA